MWMMFLVAAGAVVYLLAQATRRPIVSDIPDGPVTDESRAQGRRLQHLINQINRHFEQAAGDQLNVGLSCHVPIDVLQGEIARAGLPAPSEVLFPLLKEDGYTGEITSSMAAYIRMVIEAVGMEPNATIGGATWVSYLGIDVWGADASVVEKAAALEGLTAFFSQMQRYPIPIGLSVLDFQRVIVSWRLYLLIGELVNADSEALREVL